MRLTTGLLAVLSLLCAEASSAVVFEVTASSTTVRHQATFTNTFSIAGQALNVWIYEPKAQTTSYANFWSQASYAGTIATEPTDPPAELWTYPEGVWCDFGNRDNVILKVIRTEDVDVGVNLPGIQNDLVSGGTGTWYRATTNCPDNIPGLASTMQNIEQNVVIGTADTKYGVLERSVAWLRGNVTRQIAPDKTDATSVYTSLKGDCDGFAHLLKSMLLHTSKDYGVGVVIGETFLGTSRFSSSVGTWSLDSTVGAHAWNVVDDGSQWIPVDAFYGTVGLAPCQRVCDAVTEDADNARGIWIYDYYPDQKPTLAHSLNISNTTTGSVNYSTSRVRNPYPTITWANQAYASSSLRPQSDGYPVTGVPEDPIVDRRKANTLLSWPNPAVNRVEVQMFLEKTALVTAQAFDPAGRLAATVLQKVARGPGYEYFSWDTRDVAAGIYFLHLDLTADGRTQAETLRVAVVH